MAFNGSEGSPIDKEMASTWTKNYREANPKGAHAHFMGREILLALLGQKGCMGIRFYYGLNDGVQQLLGVGVDSNMNDQLGEDCQIADDTKICPPYCSEPNSLNG